MEMLHQIFITVTAALTFFILIVKFASSATVNNGDQDQLKSSKVETSSTKRKGKKIVRFGVDHDEFVIDKPITEPSKTNEFVINKVIPEQSETKSVVFEQNEIEDVNKEKKESRIELIDQKSSCEVNVGNCNLNDEKCVELMCDDGIDESVKEKEGLISEEDDSSDDDDWEGVERSDLEKVFAVAADYGKVDDNLQNVESDVQMQLYGLHKVATEGPCHEGRPMVLKVSARAKWNAWQKLGNMNPDAAMEQYITLLSEKVPGWSQGIHDSVDKN